MAPNEITPELKQEIRELIGSKQERSIAIERASVNVDDRTVKMAFSSATPYERWWGVEILDHSPGAVRMGRLENNAAVLKNHNWDLQVGAVKSASIDHDGFGRADVRISRTGPGQDALQDIEDGILTKVSVGYIVHKMVLEEENKDGPDVYRVTDWEPYEVSFVSVPADDAVGVGRAMENNETPTEAKEKEPEMAAEVENKEVVAVVDVNAEKAAARKSETDRVKNIMHAGRKFGFEKEAEQAISDDTPFEVFARMVNDNYEVNQNPMDANVGLTEKETQSYSLTRAINAMANPTDQRAQAAAGFEMECSRAAEAKMTGQRNGNLAIPSDILQRDMTVGTAADGGYLKGTDHMGGSFIEVLRNRAMVMQMGARQMTGLVGDVAIPSMTAANTAYWVAESGTPTESKPTMGQLALSPKTIAAYSDLSRKLIQQSSPAVDGLVFDDLGTVLGLGIDLSALHGTGSSNQPTGIAATSGIGDVAGGTNGLAPTWAHIVKLETEVSQNNADVGTLGYLTNAKARGKLKQTFKNSTGGDTPIFGDGNEPGFGMMNGYRAGVTNQVSSTLTKGTSSGVCSAIFFGNWADMIVALWGGLDLLVDPYTGSSSGTVRVTAFQSCDIGIRHASSFAAMLDALTT